jgi:hypothetical protein
MTAVLVELGTMVGIIAVAQPTWTRGLVEQLDPPQQVHTGQADSPTSPGFEFDLRTAPPIDRVSSLVLPPPMDTPPMDTRPMDTRPISTWNSHR